MAAASGWLCSLAYPDTAVSSVAFVALVPLLVAVRTSPATFERCAIGALWMLCFAWGINDWFPPAVARYYQRSWVFGFAFFLAVTLLSAAPATIFFALVYGRMGRRVHPLAPLTAAAAWTSGELLRTRALGDPWGLLGYSQAPQPEWIQVADLAGVFGVGFVVVLVNAFLAEVLLTVYSRTRVTLALVSGLLAAAALPALALGYGHWRLRVYAGGQAVATREVVVAQGNVDFGQLWQPEAYKENLGLYLRLTEQGLRGTSNAIVVWPENALASLLDQDGAILHSMAKVLGPSGAMLVAGAPRRTKDAEFRNSAFLVGSDGAVRDHYDKQRLLPFGEYQPIGSLDLVRRRFDNIREFAPGPPREAVLDADGLSLGVVICNEAMFAEPARERVAGGADVLLALTNDTWVGESRFASQAFDMAILRAVEQRTSLVRSSTSGPSALVDSRGRVVARTSYGETSTLRGHVPVGRKEDRSPYSRLGDIFAWLCVAGSVAGLRVGGPAPEVDA